MLHVAKSYCSNIQRDFVRFLHISSNMEADHRSKQFIGTQPIIWCDVWVCFHYFMQFLFYVDLLSCMRQARLPVHLMTTFGPDLPQVYLLRRILRLHKKCSAIVSSFKNVIYVSTNSIALLILANCYIYSIKLWEILNNIKKTSDDIFFFSHFS